VTSEELTESELDEPFAPSIDRIIRHVSEGVFDEERIELALFLDQTSRRETWLTRTFSKRRIQMVAWDAILEAELSSAPPSTWQPTSGIDLHGENPSG
jgi:hypothetical protein